MPSVDIVSRVDLQEVDNTVNNAVKEITNRYDFRGSDTELTLDKKDKVIRVVTSDTMKMEAIREILLTKAVKRGIETKVFDFGEVLPGGKNNVKQEIKIREGLEKELAQKIVKQIKEMKLKVQAAIQGDELRVTGKQIDDLQSVMQMLKAKEDLPVPLQFVNMKRD
jgi:uncharacterized protein YajQ (UPF0234 family)